MTLSLGLVLALLLLAPGLAAYAALFVAVKDPQFRPAPPPPGSILTLVILIIAALASHALGALVAALNDWFCAHHRCIAVGFNPNAYVTALGMESKAGAPGSADIAAALLYELALSAFAYIGVRITMHQRWASTQVHGLLYGWLGELVAQSAQDNMLVTAFVLTKFKDEDRCVGYEGITENITLDDTKTITSITITDCTAFIMKIEDKSISRTSVNRETPIPRLYISGEQIENIAFSVFDVSAGAEAV